MKKGGFTNIRIYNGGIKDWEKNGYPLLSDAPLPQQQVTMISTGQLYTHLQNLKRGECRAADGRAQLTILDLRNENLLNAESIPPKIDTVCPTVEMYLDDLMVEEKRAQVPREGMVVVITETGSRDEYAIRYLAGYGYQNLVGLEFGMRGWIKERLPVK